MPAKQQFCSFFLDNLFFGVEVEKVQEVIRYQRMTPVPLAPKVVSGLINLRGQIVTVIDLRRLLMLSNPAESIKPMNVVICTQKGTFSLLVDRVGEVLEPAEDSFEHPPDTLKGIDRELIQGAYKLPGNLLLTLNTEKLVSTDMLNFTL